MGKYAQAIGYWTVTLNDVEFKLKPKMGDNEKLAKVMNAYQKNKDLSSLLKAINGLFFEMVIRQDVHSDEEAEELKTLIELHQMPLLEEMLIAFKFTKREDLEKARREQGDSLKNLIQPSS